MGVSKPAHTAMRLIVMMAAYPDARQIPVFLVKWNPCNGTAISRPSKSNKIPPPLINSVGEKSNAYVSRPGALRSTVPDSPMPSSRLSKGPAKQAEMAITG